MATTSECNKDGKTCCDVNSWDGSGVDVSVEVYQLRLEAIKWVKAYRDAARGVPHQQWPAEVKEANYLFDTDDFLKYFFNLSEEDLK